MRSYSVTNQNDFELEFCCDRCGHTGRVLIVTQGMGSSLALSWLFRRAAVAEAESKAARDAAENAAQLVRLRKCPSCGHRGGLAGFALRAAFTVLLTGAVAFIPAGALGMLVELLYPGRGLAVRGLALLGLCAFAYGKYEHWKLAEAGRRVRFLHVSERAVA